MLFDHLSALKSPNSSASAALFINFFICLSTSDVKYCPWNMHVILSPDSWGTVFKRC